MIIGHDPWKNLKPPEMQLLCYSNHTNSAPNYPKLMPGVTVGTNHCSAAIKRLSLRSSYHIHFSSNHELNNIYWAVVTRLKKRNRKKDGTHRQRNWRWFAIRSVILSELTISVQTQSIDELTGNLIAVINKASPR